MLLINKKVKQKPKKQKQKVVIASESESSDSEIESSDSEIEVEVKPRRIKSKKVTQKPAIVKKNLPSQYINTTPRLVFV